MKLLIELLNGNKAIVREAVIEDAVKMIKYLQNISDESDFLTFGQGELKITREIEESIIEEYMNANNKVMMVVEYNDEIIGNLRFDGGKRDRVKHTGEFGVSVKREFWNNGIAEKLIESLVLWAKDNRIITKINLRVREDNDRAIRLYKRMGFTEEGKLTREFCLNGIYYSSILMGLEI